MRYQKNPLPFDEVRMWSKYILFLYSLKTSENDLI